MVCSKEVSFKAWQNWWDGDTKHYTAFRAAPLYKENCGKFVQGSVCP